MSATHGSQAWLDMEVAEMTAREPVPSALDIDQAPDRLAGGTESVALHLVEGGVAPPFSDRRAADSTGHGHGFHRELRREKRRADRSKAPLSIAVYRIDSQQPARIAEGAHLEAVIDAAKRETDIFHRVSDTEFAVLFPETSGNGLQRFMASIAVKLKGLPVTVASATYPGNAFETLVSSLRSQDGPTLVAVAAPASEVKSGYALKRALDVLGSLFALALLSPLMIVTALAIATTSRGPVIYKQSRMGRGGIPFTFYKFRSMVTNVDDGVHRQFVAKLIKGENPDSSDGGVTSYKIKRDPRVTFVGRVIRRLSIDEVPQFFNVLKGDMSLVGPRPPLPYEVDNYLSWHQRRVHGAKPGITGIWQVEGRSRVSFDDMVRMDLYYAKNCSLALDIKILFKTVAVVLRGDGAA